MDKRAVEPELLLPCMYMLGWLHAKLAQNLSMDVLYKTSFRVSAEHYCLLMKTEDKLVSYC